MNLNLRTFISGVGPLLLAGAARAAEAPARPAGKGSYPRAHEVNPYLKHRNNGLVSDRFPDAVLTGHDDRSYRFYTDLIAGKIVFINFMYARCRGICAGNTEAMCRIHDALKPRMGKDVFMLSLSVDPAEDTPEALRFYMETREAKGRAGWTFAVGTPADTEVIRRVLGAYDPDPKADAVVTNHSGMLTFGNDRNNRWAALPTTSNLGQVLHSFDNITRAPRSRQI